jgi:hypothetical protein
MPERFDHAPNRESRSDLSQELARTNPEAYLRKLVDLTEQNTTYTTEAWEFLRELPGQPQELEVNPNSWEGYSDSKTIKVGAAPMPADWKSTTILRTIGSMHKKRRCMYLAMKLVMEH